MWSLSKNWHSHKKSSFSRKRESSVFNTFWIPRSSRRMTNTEFLDKLCVPSPCPSSSILFSYCRMGTEGQLGVLNYHFFPFYLLQCFVYDSELTKKLNQNFLYFKTRPYDSRLYFKTRPYDSR